MVGLLALGQEVELQGVGEEQGVGGILAPGVVPLVHADADLIEVIGVELIAVEVQTVALTVQEVGLQDLGGGHAVVALGGVGEDTDVVVVGDVLVITLQAIHEIEGPLVVVVAPGQSDGHGDGGIGLLHGGDQLVGAGGGDGASLVLSAEEVGLVAHVPQMHAEGIKAQGLSFTAVLGGGITVAVLHQTAGVLSVGEDKADGVLGLGVQLLAEHHELVETDIQGILVVGVAEQEPGLGAAVGGLAELGSLEALLPVEVICGAAAGVAEGGGSDHAKLLDDVPTHAVEGVGGQKGDLVHGGLALGLHREGTVRKVDAVKHEGQRLVGLAVGDDRKGLLHACHAEGDGGSFGIGLDPCLGLVGLARLEGNIHRGLGHGAVFQNDEIAPAEAFLGSVGDSLKSLADPAVHPALSHGELAVVEHLGAETAENASAGDLHIHAEDAVLKEVAVAGGIGADDGIIHT